MIIEKETDSEDFETLSPNESVRDSLSAAMEELDDEKPEADIKLQGDQGEAETEPTEEEASKAAKILAKSKRGKRTIEASELDLGQGQKQSQEGSQAIQPPARWPVEKKEWFFKQPKEVQEEAVRGWQDLESHTTKLWQDLNREYGRAKIVNDILDQYVPKWNLQGITKESALAELCAMQDLIQRNPVEAYNMMLERSGLSPEDLINYRDSGQKRAPVQNQGLTISKEDLHTEFNNLWHQQQYKAKLEYEANQIMQLGQEMTADGRYAWPEIQNPQLLQQLQPFVEHLRKTQPMTPVMDIFKRAINAYRASNGQVQNGSPSSQLVSKLQNNQENLNRMKAASVSVSGQGAMPTQGLAVAKPGESVADSLRAVYGAMGNNYN